MIYRKDIDFYKSINKYCFYCAIISIKFILNICSILYSTITKEQ